MFNDGSKISRSLVDLRNQVEALDPNRQGDLLQPRKLLGLIPWGNRLHDYFQQYQSAQQHIDAIIVALYGGQDELRKDNAAIEEEKVNAWHTMEKLEQYIHVGRGIDAALELSWPKSNRPIRKKPASFAKKCCFTYGRRCRT